MGANSKGMGVINFRYRAGRLLKKVGYKLSRDYRWPEVHGNLLLLGFSLLRAHYRGEIQIVQVGAFDGQIDDPLEHILRDKNVSAVLVEPQTGPYEALVARYGSNPRISVVNAAVAETDGQATLYVPSSQASPKASLIAGHHRRFGVRAREIHEVVVSSVTVASLLKRCRIEHVHILQIDAEGMDYRVLKWFLGAGVQPDVLNFENLHLGRRERLASRELLREKGYWWIETNQDTFALKESLARP